jgi:RNA polymerase sigma-70 factor (ECF subfamily)
MNDRDWLAERFEQDRPRLRAVAYRMLGSLAEADDAVQDAWFRLSRSDTSGVENMSGWLTTIVARVSLNMLQSRASRREELREQFPDTAPGSADAAADPEQEALLAESVGLALLVILDTLTPAERLAFVLHDMFAVPFEEIAPIVGRSPAAARQLASRARRRVQRADATADGEGTNADAAVGVSQENLVRAFLTASRDGDFDALLAVLDPDVVLRTGQVAVQLGVDGEVRGANAVARFWAGRARAARPALIDGVPGLVWAQSGEPRVVFRFVSKDGAITAIDIQADLADLDITMLRNRVRARHPGP